MEKQQPKTELKQNKRKAIVISDSEDDSETLSVSSIEKNPCEILSKKLQIIDLELESMEEIKRYISSTKPKHVTNKKLYEMDYQSSKDSIIRSLKKIIDIVENDKF